MSNESSFKWVGAGMLFYTGVVIAVALIAPANDKLYILMSLILGNFQGSLFTLLQHQIGSTVATKVVPPVPPNTAPITTTTITQ